MLVEMSKVGLSKGRDAEKKFHRLMSTVKAEFSLSSEGNPSANILTFNDTMAQLGLCLVRNKGVQGHHFEKSILVGIRKSLESDDFSLKYFLKSSNSYLNDLSNEKLERYVMWTTSNIKSDNKTPANSVYIDGVRVYIGPKLPQGLNDASLAELEMSSIHDQPKSETFLWGYAEHFDELSAGNSINQAIELFAALINFQSIWKRNLNLFPPKLVPEAPFFCGPNFYLRLRDENDWSSIIWMSENHNPKLWRQSRTTLEGLMPAFPAIRNHFKAISRSPFDLRLRKTIQHLNASWSASSKSQRATFLWMAAESLFSDLNNKSDKSTIVRRAVRFIRPADKIATKERFDYLFELRTSAVHSYKDISDNDSMGHLLQHVSSVLIANYLNLLNIDKRIVTNDSIYIRLLELPSDEKYLDKQRELIDFALSYQEPKQKSPNGIRKTVSV